MVLTLTQDPQVQETNVAVAIVLKLYDLANDNNNTVKLVGSITVSAAYDKHVTFLNSYTANNSDFTITAGTSYIWFDDRAIQTVLLSNVSHAGDGITAAECLVVTSMDAWFKNNTDIDHFGEFSRFTNLTNTDLLFYGSSIRTIDLSALSVIGASCFRNCSNLTIGPTDILNVKQIRNDAFRDGSYKNNTLVLSKLTYLGDFAFYNCPLLEQVDMTGCTITAMNSGVFANCNITKIKLPTDIITFGKPSGATPITFKTNTDAEIYGLDNVTTVNSSIHGNIVNAVCLRSYSSGTSSIINANNNNASSINQLYYPSFYSYSVTNIGSFYSAPNSTFFTYRCYGSAGKLNINLLYFKDLHDFQKYMFFLAVPKALVINNITPPQVSAVPNHDSSIENGYEWSYWSTKAFGSIPVASSAGSSSGMTIYVPDSAVSAYAADSNYNDYPIAGISTLNGGVIYATEQDWIDAGKPNGLIAEYLGYSPTDLATFVSTYNLTYYTPSNS